MGGSRIVFGIDKGEINLSLKKLDSVVIDDDQVVKLIKIDVEGHEFEALLGAEGIIKKYQPIIIFEQHVSDFEGNSTKAIELIKAYNYSKFACIEKSPSPSASFPVFLQLLYSTISRLVFGSSRSIVLMEIFQPKFYPFIIAIPNWLASELNDQPNRSSA